MDGWVTIGSKLDTKQLEKDLKDEQRRLERFEKEAEKLTTAKIKAKVDLQEYERLKQVIEKTTETNMKFASTEKGKKRVLEEQNRSMQELNQAYSKQLNNLNEINKKIEKNAYNQALVKNEIEETTSKLKQARGFDGIKDSIDNIGKSVQKVTKKVVRWGLAIFGIRSAYMLVRQSMSTLSQYDDQMATDIEYIRYAIANTLKPVIEWILNLVKQLFYYVGYLAKAWFNVNLFANATAQGFKDAKDNAKGLNKEVNKTLAGFDEMNTLQSNKSEDNGTILPSFDLSKIQEVKIPKWLEWIKDHGKEVAAILGMIIGSKLLGNLTGLLGLAAAALIVYDAIKYKELYDEWNALKKYRDELNKWQKNIHKQYVEGSKDKKKEARSYEVGSQKMAQYIGQLESNTRMNKVRLESGKLSIEQFKREAEEIQNNVDLYKDLYENGKLTTEQIKDYANFMADLGLKIDGTKMSVKDYTTYQSILKSGTEDAADKARDFASQINGIGTAADNTKGKSDNLKTSVDGLTGGLTDLTNKNWKLEIQSTLLKPDTSDWKKTLNNLLDNLSYNLNKGLGSIGGALSLGTIKIPRLAKGGIINNPGKGVYTGTAITGEAGREFYMPLQDEQMLSLVGEAIGKYVNINLTNITNLDGRQIARKVNKVQQNNNFVLNR